MVIIGELPEVLKTIIIFLHFIFYGLIIVGVLLAEGIFMVLNYSLFNQE